MIKLSKNDLQIVKTIFKNHVPNFEVFVFGSRVNGNIHDHSDLDIALKGPDKIDLLLLADIKDEFQNSDVPFRVDIIDFNRVSPEFQKVILNNHFLLKL
ncbi:MAG: nucleotidyltransferase domain-containing protein [Clostridia bacterium]|nr:nucleotidyltransferase domain-containing protein [Clostridia bacterium]